MLIKSLIVSHVFRCCAEFSVRFDDLLDGTQEIFFRCNLKQKSNSSNRKNVIDIREKKLTKKKIK